MPYDVFISYSKPDKTTADAVCGTLEAQGVRCWIAPRDVEPGRDWSESIIDALNHVPVMVLVFSSHANGSPQVRREVQRAFEKNITVIPFRVENVMPVQSLEYYIGPVHWLDALTPPLDSYLQQLCRTVKRLLVGRNAPDEHGPSVAPPSAATRAPVIAPPPPIPHVEPRAPTPAPAGAQAKVASPSPPSERKRPSALVPLGICTILGLTILGGIYVWRMKRPDTAPPSAADNPGLAVATTTTTHTERAVPLIEIPPGENDETTRMTRISPLPATGEGEIVLTTAQPSVAFRDESHALGESGEPPVSGQPWEVPDLGLQMVFIRPGSFTMGSAPSEKMRQGNEGPQTRVTVSSGFWLGKFEVTFAQWLQIMRGRLSRMKEGNVSTDAPVSTISWDDVADFCQRLNERETRAGRMPPGFRYALPTEAQWEYACRAGTTTPFSFGERLDADLANFDGTEPYGGAPSGVFRTDAVSVGRFPANRWGLHDMHGNVAEWTASFSSRALPGGSVADPVGSSTGSGRVVRGGSWNDSAASCRSAARVEAPSDAGSDLIGFRIALVPAR